jgi:hypothetical protein
MVRLPAQLFAFALAVSCLPAGAQNERAVRDWIAGCDNTRHCRAIGLAPDGEHAWTYLTFERGGAADAVVDAVVITLEGTPPRDGRWVLRSGGEPVFDVAAGQFNCSDDACRVLIGDPGQLARLFDEFRRSDRLSIDRDGEVFALVSLVGASAVMLWIDEAQRRLDTPTAFVRRGDRPADTIAAPPAPPEIRAEIGAWTAIASARIASLVASARDERVRSECDDPEFVPHDSEAWQRVDGTTQMLALACSAGAYNYSALWLWRDSEDAPWSPVPIDNFDASGRLVADSDSNLVNAGFSPDRGELHAFAKARGLGDCGTLHAWVWNGERFALESLHAMGECRGVAAQHWPRLWRAIRD